MHARLHLLIYIFVSIKPFHAFMHRNDLQQMFCLMVWKEALYISDDTDCVMKPTGSNLESPLQMLLSEVMVSFKWFENISRVIKYCFANKPQPYQVIGLRWVMCNVSLFCRSIACPGYWWVSITDVILHLAPSWQNMQIFSQKLPSLHFL